MELYGIFLDRELLREEETALLASLPPQWRQRAERSRDPSLRRDRLLAYGLLALALREQYGISALPDIAAGKNGKPFFLDRPEIFFSISHTRGAALVGVHDASIGVDVEHLRPIGKRTMERLGKGMTEEEFLRVWVRREARAKRSGAGLAEAMGREPDMEANEHYREVGVPEGFFAGVSFVGDSREIELNRRTMEDILL